MRAMLLYLPVLLFGPCSVFAQTIKVKLLFTAQPDSVFVLTSGSQRFDKEGAYCFTFQEGERAYYAQNNSGRIGPFRSTSSAFSGKGSVTFLYNGYDEEKEFYYKNVHGTRFFGPVSGKVEQQITENAKDRVALTLSRTDTIFFYVDDRLLAKRLRTKNTLVETDEWCTFSRNGRSLYYVPNDSVNVLYVDDKPIDTSTFRFYELHIVDNGDFTYAKGEKPKTKSKYTFLFFIHTRDTVMGPVRTVWKHFLNEDGSYYYTGDDEGPDYIAVNNTLYKGLESVDHILLPDRRNYAFTFTTGTQRKMNVNGHLYTYDFEDLYCPAMDSSGNFAVYGLKDYYLYKYVNGVRQAKPLSKYGARAAPLYISPQGSSVHYFKTDDTTYLYKDEELLLPPIANKYNFQVFAWNEVLGTYPPREKPGRKNTLVYFEFDSTGYFLFNGTLSRPLHKVKKIALSKNQETGRIVMGNLFDEGFFVVQKTAGKEYTINVNNDLYTTLQDVDGIDRDDYFFDGKELTVFVQKGLSYYQYKIAK